MMGFGFMGFGLLIMVAFWIGVILLVVWAMRGYAPRTEASSGMASALDLAKARYARGEISRAEFEEIRKTIEQK